MVERKQLLADLKPLLKELETDLRTRCDEVPQIDADLKQEYEQAKDAGRTGAAFEAWRADLITQVAAAWVLSCVFVRFLEDNELISPPRISGPLHGAGEGRGMLRARDERDLYFKEHPTDTDRDYLLTVFDDQAKLPGAKDIFGAHNPVSAYRDWLSGDAAQKLIEFFQKIDKDETGELIHDFTNSDWDTRFLGDLYQDLSETARKKYALLQTPEFIEEFILERTLEPAIDEFGLQDFKMIDPACGSGHFLLGAFARLLNRWRAEEPATPDRELMNRALAAVHGVDLNPYAIAIARFRLLVAVMRESQITRLREAPVFAMNLACGDSLLHGAPGKEQQMLGFHEVAHAYEGEDLSELRRILSAGVYHAVVANPPYITVKDRALNKAYRERYPEVCYMKYSLSVPFMQRLFGLACESGFTGQITANSFMKREFGKKLIESYLPKVDVTHVIDTSGAYIPGHGTPTLILFGRNRAPVVPVIRAVMGIRGEPNTPADPASGLVWTAILEQIDHAGSQSAFVSVTDSQRQNFAMHPWSIGGGGATELKEQLDQNAVSSIRQIADSVGVMAIAGNDDVFVDQELPVWQRRNIDAALIRIFITGDDVRDWAHSSRDHCLFPYGSNGDTLSTLDPKTMQYLWPFRTTVSSGLYFGKRKSERGMRWFEYAIVMADRSSALVGIHFAAVATHNHFAVKRQSAVCNRHSPVITLAKDATEEDHLALIGLLNCSTACFWFKQIGHNKGDSTDQNGARTTGDVPFNTYEYSAGMVKDLPLCKGRPLSLATKLDALSQENSRCLSFVSAQSVEATTVTSADVGQRASELRCQMIALQEELDWECYSLYGLLETAPRCDAPPLLQTGERAFEIALARRVAAGQEETTWFTRHGATPIIEIPAAWPDEYKQVVRKRIGLIESDRNIGLIERPEYKRRWQTEPCEQQHERALRFWLLNRVESYFDVDGRMNDRMDVSARGHLREPRLTSTAKLTDLARADQEFMQAADVYTGRMDFDVAALVGELVAAESVPALPVMRYKPDALDKRRAWAQTWELQRLEDAVYALFEVDRLKELAEALKDGDHATAKVAATLPIEETKRRLVAHELHEAAGYVAEAVKQKLNLTSDNVSKPVQDAAKRAKKAAVGDIAVPPKYKNADFLDSNFWRLRGKLDVPKERWVSFPHCEGEDGTLVIAWAGYDHLQLARAIAERYELAKEQEGRKLVPLLAAIGQLIPWLKQWHNDLDPAFGTRMGDYYENYLAEEAKAIGKSVEEIMAWTPPAKVKKTRKKATAKP